MDSWSDEEDVTTLTAFMDPGQPYSCTQWGNNGINGYPVMTNDGNGFAIPEKDFNKLNDSEQRQMDFPGELSREQILDLIDPLRETI